MDFYNYKRLTAFRAQGKRQFKWRIFLGGVLEKFYRHVSLSPLYFLENETEGTGPGIGRISTSHFQSGTILI